MPRSREFEPNEALHKAMLLFWQQGYLDTSIDDLVRVTGVSRYGFYSAFGDKQALFLKAMNHYAGTVINTLLGPLETTAAALPEIHGYFHALLADSETSPKPAGCLIGNTAMELVHIDAAIAARVDDHFCRMRAAFLNALQNAVQQGEIAADSDVTAYADYLVGIAVGFLVCIRARMRQEALTHFIEVALAKLS